MNHAASQHLSMHTNAQGPWKSLFLAVLVHLSLFAFLWIGISWQNQHPVAVEAEVWDMTTRQAAPLPLPQTEPEPEPEAVKPEPVKVREPEPVPQVDPEIALRQEKKRKQELAHQEELKREQERKEKLAEEKRKEEKLAKEKADKLAKDKAEKLEKEQQLAKEKAEKAKQIAKEKAAADKVFKENMARLTAQAGTGGTGTAEKSTGNNRGDPGYAAKVAAKVRSNTSYTGLDSGSDNPKVEYRIELLPDGSLRGAIRKLKSSGNLAFDEAVARGILASAPFPRDKSGVVPPSLDLTYRMKE